MQVRDLVRSPVGYALVIGTYTPLLLLLDATGPRGAQTVGAVVTWALLAVVWLAVVREERRSSSPWSASRRASR
jgi:hypothetical protein